MVDLRNHCRDGLAARFPQSGSSSPDESGGRTGSRHNDRSDCGALLVGDSVRGSLTDLTLERLGKIDLLLINDRFFDPQLVNATIAFSGTNELGVQDAEGLCLIANVTVEGRTAGRVRNVLLVGRHAAAMADLGEYLGEGQMPFQLGEEQIVINQALANDLGAEVGDELIIRLPVANEVPAESPLGRKDDRVRSRAGLVVAAILPMKGWGQFQLTASQQQPRTAFVRDAVLQRALGVDQRINAIAVKAKSHDRSTDVALAESLTASLPVTPQDVGFNVELVRAAFNDGDQAAVAWSYAQVTTDRMIFSQDAIQVATDALEKLGRTQPIFTYLANSIAKVVDEASSPELDANEIPYSTIAAVDPLEGLGPYVDANGIDIDVAAGQMVLNEWAADDLQAKIGDRIEVRYFAPETTHGEAREESAQFELAAILPLRKPMRPFQRRKPATFDQMPYWSNDPQLTPTVAGVTDQESIDDWDPPFPFDSTRVRDQDDEYWSEYRTTPKAFVSFTDGQALWGSRFGRQTAVRIALADGVDAEAIEARLADEIRSDPGVFGFRFRPVMWNGLAASRGTTPFEWLFLGFSMFLLFSALALTTILFRLATMLRQKELGTMVAIGWPTQLAARVLVVESSLVAFFGGVLGVFGGILFAAAMLVGLRTWWLAAVVTPFMRLHLTSHAIIFGFLAGLVANMFVVWWTLRKLRNTSPIQLLRGLAEQVQVTPRRIATWPIAVAIAISLALAAAGTKLSGESQAGCFFGGGAALLVGLLWIVRRRLRQPLDRADVQD